MLTRSARSRYVGRVSCKIAWLSIALALFGCRKEEPGTATGTKVLMWARGGYAGNTIADDGPDATDTHDLTIVFADGSHTRLLVKGTHGSSLVTFKDGSAAKRDTPRRIEAVVADSTRFVLTVQCSAEVSGPTEKKPNALFTACEIHGPPADGEERRAVFRLFGDGELETIDAGGAKIIVNPT
jgi:hypothetical protein